nr:MAG TPA: hypothetical protein [Bacteriophage sp.]
MADLKTNYVDDVLDTTKNQLRKYQQIQNDDGTVSFVDVTEYTQVGTLFGAKDMNDTNAAINDVNRKLGKNTITKIQITNASFSSGALVITDKIPQGMRAFGFIITGGTPVSHTAQVWENLANSSINVTFKTWADNTVAMSGTVSGILLCI